MATDEQPAPGSSPRSRWLPVHSVPITSWRAPSRWRARPITLLILFVGLYLFGTGEAILVQAGLGVSPWTVFAQGLGLRLGISVGWATLVISVIVLLAWLPLRERPGLGTIANALVVSLALGVGMLVLPAVDGLGMQMLAVTAGVAIIGLGSGFYLTTGLGPGPRDGLMTGIHLRTNMAVVPVRWGIELTALAIGWQLGGTVGPGTMVFAALIGPSVGYGLLVVGRLGGHSL